MYINNQGCKKEREISSNSESWMNENNTKHGVFCSVNYLGEGRLKRGGWREQYPRTFFCGFFCNIIYVIYGWGWGKLPKIQLLGYQREFIEWRHWVLSATAFLSCYCGLWSKSRLVGSIVFTQFLPKLESPTWSSEFKPRLSCVGRLYSYLELHKLALKAQVKCFQLQMQHANRLPGVAGACPA